MKEIIKFLTGKYLRGFMDKDDADDWEHYVYIYVDSGKGTNIECVKCSYDDDDGYRDSFWDFEIVTEFPDIDKDYKVIGEEITEVYEDDSDFVDRTFIKTKTRILKFETEYFDSYYPTSLWEFI